MNRSYIIDTDKNRIDFIDKRYYLDKDGMWWPSNTTILDAYPKTAQFFEWLKKNGDMADAIRDEAGEEGTAVHDLTEMYDNGDAVSLVDTNNRQKYKQVVWSMFERYVDFTRKCRPDIVHNELHLVDGELGFGGTLDRIMTFPEKVEVVGGKKILVDIKTSGSIHNHYWLQLTGYVKLYEKLMGDTVDGIAILWLRAKTRSEGRKGSVQGIGWQMVFPTETLDHYWHLFQCVHQLWLEENKDSKPKNISYQLSHSKIKQWD